MNCESALAYLQNVEHLLLKVEVPKTYSSQRLATGESEADMSSLKLSARTPLTHKKEEKEVDSQNDDRCLISFCESLGRVTLRFASSFFRRRFGCSLKIPFQQSQSPL